MFTKSIKNSKNSPTLRERFQTRYAERYRENYPLGSFVSAKLGGVAEYLVTAETLDDLIEAATLAAQHKVEYRVIGSGSATLPSEVGFPGLVIINQTSVSGEV